MDFSHTLEQASELSDKALRMMREKAIPPHPNNYTVWYSYSSGQFPHLNSALDILLDNQIDFSEERNLAVYRKFCASPSDAVPVHLIAEKIQAELVAVVGALEAGVCHSTIYGQTLAKARDLALAITNPQALGRLINAIIEKTATVAEQTRELELQLRASLNEVAQLREQLEGARREAMTDALTGLANRKMFEFVLREAAVQAIDSGEPLSLLLLDVDHFKKFNDTYGHAIGDLVLKLLAGALRNAIKGQDTAARYGGEEFAVILPCTELKDASKLAEAIRHRVTTSTVIHRKTGGTLGRVSVSIGVAEMQPGEPLRSFVERADQALYYAKRTGRNRVMWEWETMSEATEHHR